MIIGQLTGRDYTTLLVKPVTREGILPLCSHRIVRGLPEAAWIFGIARVGRWDRIWIPRKLAAAGLPSRDPARPIGIVHQDRRGASEYIVRVGLLRRWTTSATEVHAFYLEFHMGLMVMVGQMRACDGSGDGNAG